MRMGATVAMAALALVACGGGSSASSGDPVSQDDAQALCADFGAHSDECGWSGNVNAADWNCGEAAQVWRADVFRAFVDCAIALPCDGDGQSCYAGAFSTPPLAIHDQYAESCAQRSSECAFTGTSDTSSLILQCDADRLAAYAAPIVQDVIDCFALACDAVVPCLDGVL
jgi:hypothetical protein